MPRDDDGRRSWLAGRSRGERFEHVRDSGAILIPNLTCIQQAD